MTFSRGQTQVLYQFLPGAIFEHDRYGFCRVTSVELRETTTNQSALFEAVADHLWQWEDESFRPGFPDPRNENSRRNYVIGTPTSVRFDPYPTILECRRCARVWRLQDLMRRANVRPRHCPVCQGLLGQLRYVQAHNCGRLEELYYPPACPTHGDSYLIFDDTGRVRTARWRCGACGGAERARLRMTPCTCPYARRMVENQYERGLKTLTVTDSALFLPHVVPFINFNEEEERRLYGDSELLALSLARTWGILDAAVPEIIRARQQRREHGTTSQESDDMTAALVRELESRDPNNPLVVRWHQQQHEQATAPGEDAIGQVRNLLGPSAPAAETFPPRQLVEHVAILDTLRSTTADDICSWMQGRGDEAGKRRMREAERFAHDHLGMGELRIIDDFPIALCAIGFTRITRDPTRSMLSPFETDDPQGRIPLYVVEAETEGIYFQLNPLEVVRWLFDNGWITGGAPTNRSESWAWLYQHIPGLRKHRWEPEYHDPLAVCVRTLEHTISHVLLRHVEWSGFSQNSVGEYLLPSSLACVLYANRYAETKIGGLTTLFEQRLGIWLSDSAQSGRDCVYDPFCTDEGGTCVGCLHREHNCPQFNRELSRAVLYGGPTPPAESGGEFGMPIIRRGYWEFVPPLAQESEMTSVTA